VRLDDSTIKVSSNIALSFMHRSGDKPVYALLTTIQLNTMNREMF